MLGYVLDIKELKTVDTEDDVDPLSAFRDRFWDSPIDDGDGQFLSFDEAKKRFPTCIKEVSRFGSDTRYFWCPRNEFPSIQESSDTHQEESVMFIRYLKDVMNYVTRTKGTSRLEQMLTLVYPHLDFFIESSDSDSEDVSRKRYRVAKPKKALPVQGGGRRPNL